MIALASFLNLIFCHLAYLSFRDLNLYRGFTLSFVGCCRTSTFNRRFFSNRPLGVNLGKFEGGILVMLTSMAPIITNVSRNVVSDRCSISFGRVSGGFAEERVNIRSGRFPRPSREDRPGVRLGRTPGAVCLRGWTGCPHGPPSRSTRCGICALLSACRVRVGEGRRP